MPSEQCSVCGEESDADELDPHGHFDVPDDDDGDDDDDEVAVPSGAIS